MATTLDLSLGALVNAAGALFFALEGIVILILARGSRRALVVGGLALSFGVTFIVQNLFAAVGTDQDPRRWLLTVLSIVTIGMVIALIGDVAKGLPHDVRRPLLILGLVSVVDLLWIAASVIALVARNVALLAATGTELIVYDAALPLAFILLVTIAAARARTAGATEGHAMELLALAFGLWTMFQSITIAATAVQGGSVLKIALAAGLLALGLIAAAAPLLPLLLPGAGDRRRARNVLLILIATGLTSLGMVMLYGAESGAYGVVRTIGAALLAVAIVKYDLLGIPLPRVAVRRGALATGALATLFIVAQIAQNFLAAQYGLLMGGIVAGAFLFMASPLQRAIEGFRSNGHEDRERPAQASDRERRHAMYRKALRVALHDGRMTPEEERHLASLASDLGVSYAEAITLRDEVQDEYGGGSARGA